MEKNKKIYYISDLHLDRTEDEQKAHDEFIGLLNTNDYFLIPGDSYNGTEKTIKLLKELEKMKIHGFYVLGNHEYHRLRHGEKIVGMKEWDKEKKMIIDSLEKNKYFKLLYTGRIEEIEGYKIIGDTAWTNFLNEKNEKTDYKEFIKTFPDLAKKGNWPWTFKENEKFIKFAQKVINENKKVIVMTHYPLYFPKTKDFNKEDRILKKIDPIKKNKKQVDMVKSFYYSNNKFDINKDKDVVFVYGHTHNNFSYDKKHSTNGIGRGGKKITLEVLEFKK